MAEPFKRRRWALLYSRTTAYSCPSTFKHPTVIKGPPGTGKTWLGTEVLLGHAKAWNAQAWIITLNSHLAEEIEATVAENHEFGPLHRSIRRAYDSDVEADLAFKNIIKRRVKVFDVEGIMRHLAYA